MSKGYSPLIEERRRDARAILALLDSSAILKPKNRAAAIQGFREALMRLAETLLLEPARRRPQEILALEIQCEVEQEENIDCKATGDRITRLLCLWCAVEQDGISLTRDQNEQEFTLQLRCLPILDRLQASEKRRTSQRNAVYREIRAILGSQLGKSPKTEMDVAMAESLVEAIPALADKLEGLRLEYDTDWSPERIAFCLGIGINDLVFDLAARLNEIPIPPLIGHQPIALIAKMLAGMSGLCVSTLPTGEAILSGLPISRS